MLSPNPELLKVVCSVVGMPPCGNQGSTMAMGTLTGQVCETGPTEATGLGGVVEQ